jgi:hypothetical protein
VSFHFTLGRLVFPQDNVKTEAEGMLEL